MRRFLIYFVIVVFGGFLLFLVKKDSSLKDFGINLLATAFVVILEIIIENYSVIKLFIQTHTRYQKKKNKDINFILISDRSIR